MNKRKDHTQEQEREDFERIEGRLRQSRPRASEAALSRARLIAAAGGDATPSRVRGSGHRRTRVAITGLLATGVLMSGGGAAMGIAGINSSGSVGSAQYVAPAIGTNEVLGTDVTPSAPTEPTVPTETNAPDTVPGNATEDPGVIADDAQPARQVVATSGEKELPFTGLAAIPIIMCGVALLAAGAVLRWRSNSA